MSSQTKQPLSWANHLVLNTYWLGLNVATGSITPVLLPFLVALFVPSERKNTDLANLRVIGLTMAMLAQPLAGLLSDRSTLRWGRRRPFILVGALASILAVILIGATRSLPGSLLDSTLQPYLGIPTAYAALLAAVALWQLSANTSQGGLQGLIPDRVPLDQRGRASGVKAVMELAPILLVIIIGPLVDSGRVWLVVGIIIASMLITLTITLVFVREDPLRIPPEKRAGPEMLRLLALVALFLTTTQTAVRLVRSGGVILARSELPVGFQVACIGLAGLAGMVSAIFLGVYLGVRVGIGAPTGSQSAGQGPAPSSTPFTWWVINRLMFLAAVGSIQGFAQFYLSDVLGIPQAATATTRLLVVVAAFLIPATLGGGYLADRFGPRRLAGLCGLIAACGTLALLFARDMRLVMLGGAVIGLASGAFLATNWALGTRLAPAAQAGRYLGVSNLAGAGAGIVGAGIGGPLADFFNALEPGLGYLVIFSIYGSLFLLSALVLTKVKIP